MARRKLPIGIQTFRTIREEGYYYVDKTAHVRELVKSGTHYFLSRPRRFGKSLLVDTLKELFEGSEGLFRGLAIQPCWNWSVRHPVVRLSFGGGEFGDVERLRADVTAQLVDAEDRLGVDGLHGPPTARFRRLLEELHRASGERVVVLVDEYDKPILDALDDPETARANRDFLRALYGVIKDCDAHVRFAFITGVSKFSKVSLFSGLNNLEDITLDAAYATICGYTEEDLDDVFAAELNGLDRKDIRRWYNGYGWLGDSKVYNPFDVLLLFRRRKFDNYWFETGTPAFLLETLAKRGVRSVDLDGMTATAALLSTFDVDDIGTEALLFQTGYVTIAGVERHGGADRYRLGYPNLEVRRSLNESLLDRLARNRSAEAERRSRLYDLMEAGDFEGLAALFEALFAGIPYEWHVCNDIAASHGTYGKGSVATGGACSVEGRRGWAGGGGGAQRMAKARPSDAAGPALGRYDGYYATVVYSCFAALDFDVTVEDSSSRGRLDMAVRHGGRVCLFEFKVVESAGEGAAMAQLVERDYAAKYRSLGEPVHLVAVEFSRESRNIVSFEVADA